MLLSSTKAQRALHKAHVIQFKEVVPLHYQLLLHAPELAREARPGQFVHVLSHRDPHQWCFDPLLRRAFSIMSVGCESESRARETVTILFRVEGRGTKELATTKVGDQVDLIGPLGQPFDVSPFAIPLSAAALSATPAENDVVGPLHTAQLFHVKQSRPHAILVGGGVGVPPMVFLGQTLDFSGVEAHAIIGARSDAEIIGYNELDGACGRVSVTTDDGSRGHQGRVTDLLPEIILQYTKQVNNSLVKPVVYACGPLSMLRSIARLCADHDVRCQVSLEENMPCGIGVCNGCVVRARQPFASNHSEGELASQNQGISGTSVNSEVGTEWSPYQTYRRICVEGPACWSHEIDWEHVHGDSQ